MEQLDENLLFCGFIGLSLEDDVRAPTVFSKDRDRLLNQVVARQSFVRVPQPAADLMSDEHSTVDGMLIETSASLQISRPQDGDSSCNGTNFPGDKPTNETPESKTDPSVRRVRKRLTMSITS